MQTFMPMFKYQDSVRALDDARLNKQILECSQILDCILDPTKGYQNHPAVNMWRGHEKALCTYGGAAAAAWRDRRGTGIDRQAWFYNKHIELGTTKGIRKDSILIPPWVGDLHFHRSHRSNLMRKDPRYYDWEGAPENMPYVWPLTTGRDEYKLYISAADMKRLETGERELPEWLSYKPDGEVFEV